MSDPAVPAPLAHTPLHALHLARGAKFAPFAGYDMPVHYPPGIIKEHLHTRASAGLFDVSHMGQAILEGADAARGLESLYARRLRNAAARAHALHAIAR